jgi:hypothetical protein
MNKTWLPPGLIFLAAGILLAAPQPAAKCQNQAKADPVLVIPEAKKIAMIRFVANGIFPEGRYDKKRVFELKLSKENQIKAVLGWLKQLDWDRSKAEDIKQLRIVARLIITAAIEVTKKDKTSQLFEIQPDHIIQGNYRWKIDRKKLKKLDAIVQGLR